MINEDRTDFNPYLKSLRLNEIFHNYSNGNELPLVRQKKYLRSTSDMSIFEIFSVWTTFPVFPTFNKRFLWLIIIFAFTLSCSHKKESQSLRTIDFQKPIILKNIVLSELADSIEYVYLEETPNSYIGRIGNLKISQNYILISDKILQRVLLFDRNGGFICQIGIKGNKAGEYGAVFDCAIDRDERNIYVYTIGNKLLRYSIDGRFLKEINIQDGKILNIKLQESNIIFSVGFPNSIFFRNCSFGVMNYNGKVIGRFLERELPVKVPPSTLIGNYNFYTIGDTACLWEYIYDTIFGLTKDLHVIPRWKINYNQDSRVSPKSFYSLGLLNEEKAKGKFIVTSLFETSHYFFISAIEQRRKKLFIFDKFRDGLFDISSKLDSINSGIKNDIDNGLDFWPQNSINEGYLIQIVDPQQIIEIVKFNPKSLPKGLVGISTKITEKSNMVLMILKMKT